MSSETSDFVVDPLLKKEISAFNKMLQDAFNQQDLGAIHHLFTDDAVLLPPGHCEIVGRQAITEYFDEVVIMGKEYGLQSRYFYDGYGVIIKDSMYYISGRYILHREDATVIDKGKYLSIAKKINGQLQLYIDIANSDLKDED
ncbi:hypothetical protein TrispH2_005392 [Trichoplax sp. H2]|uniref:DUF4440 domain-containing protein n=1 Tax=Trichoplax adhaerens TaxID=10228 RepID=B3RW02_TRIAD|nr:hypothetical protein TRIADDRAFT_55838 [Trichoplax adhaerens]EDV26090.1 hypothetical protein TRIADDRAFT_55838 [Trichoplax adhaerens]RDD43048.1 hypothetical protein TrispH2_005392 [Trichoplax sp. H2]|eukprot:XP_002112123.1 hypothetical protein TRIADDRAFT_55838 [Trichoplax adhaerens]